MRLHFILAVFVPAVLFPSLAACTTFGSAAEQITPRQTAAIRATCTKIMRLQEGLAQFDGCVASLSDSLAIVVQNERAASAEGDCERTGLERETPHFARCMLERENVEGAIVPASSPIARLDPADVKAVDNDPHSYFVASFDTRHRREQYSCAELGLEPNTQAFVGCVNNLDMDLFSIGHPPS